MLINRLYNAPAFRLFFLFSAGIITGREILFSSFVIIALIIISVTYILFQKNMSTSSALAALAVPIILAGILKSNHDFYRTAENSLLNLRFNHSGVFMKGVVADLPQSGMNKLQFVLDAEELISREDTLELSGSVLVTVRQTKEIQDTLNRIIPEAGDRVIIYGDLADAPEDANPGEFNYRNYLRLNDIEKTFRVYFTDDIFIADKNNLGFFLQHIIFPARKYAIENINNYIGGNEGAFLNGLVTGYRSDIPREMKDDFVKAGVMHILAVSGLNVAYVIIILSFVLSMLRFNLLPKISIYLASLLFYTFFAGGSASIIRAVIMGALMILVLVVQRKPNYYNIAGISALIILALDSRQLFNPGFILTYASVLSIVFFMDRINDAFPSLSRNRKGIRRIGGNILMLVLSGAAAQIGVLPITVFYFSKISVIGILTNLIAIPLSNISLALGFFQIIAGTASSFLCELIADANFMLLKFQLWFIHEMAGLGFSYVEFYGISLISILVFYIVFILITSANRKRILASVIFSVFLVGAYAVITGMKSDNLKVTYLSVGNADCTHLSAPDGSCILIDAGLENPYNHTNTQRVIPYLKYSGVKEIDLMIITSPVGKSLYTLKNLSENFRIKRIICIPEERTDARIISLADNEGIEITDARDIDEITGYGGLKFEVLSKMNSDKFMIQVIHGRCRFLFAGNNSVNDETDYLDSGYSILKSDVLKIASHGSDKSTSGKFLQAVSPSACVISCRNTGNRNIPSQSVLSRLDSSGARIFRTDTDNALIFESDGETISLLRD